MAASGVTVVAIALCLVALAGDAEGALDTKLLVSVDIKYVRRNLNVARISNTEARDKAVGSDKYMNEDAVDSLADADTAAADAENYIKEAAYATSPEKSIAAKKAAIESLVSVIEDAAAAGAKSLLNAGNIFAAINSAAKYVHDDIQGAKASAPTAGAA